MNTNKVQYNVADAMQHLTKIVKALTYEQPDKAKFKEFLNEQLAFVAEDIAKCGEEINAEGIKTASVGSGSKKTIKKPVADFTKIDFKKSCGLLSMAYPSFCQQTFIDKFNESGIKTALHYLLNYVIKADAEITVKEDKENGSLNVDFTVSRDSSLAKNQEVTIGIVNSILLAIGYTNIGGGNSGNNFSFNASMESDEGKSYKDEPNAIFSVGSFDAFVTQCLNEMFC